MKKIIKHIILGLALAISTPVLSQNKVSGTVIDENGEPVIGATVTVVGTKTATVTDLDGNYSISVPANSTILRN